MVASKNDIENARTRVIFALKAITVYVNRPASIPSDPELFQRLQDEFHDAGAAYNTLLETYKKGNDLNPPSAPYMAAD